MLIEEEQRLWDEIERDHRARHHGGRRDLPALVIGGIWAAIFLVLFDVFAAAVSVAAVTAVLWLMWRFLPRFDPQRTRPDASDDEARVVVDEQAAPLQHQPGSDVHSGASG